MVKYPDRVRLSTKAGMAPGKLVYTGKRINIASEIECFSFSPRFCRRKKIDDLSTLADEVAPDHVTWININGICDVQTVESLGNIFNIHPLVLEDILHVGQRPKFEEYDSYLYSVLRMLSFDDSGRRIIAEQVSIIIAPNCVISFQEESGDVFDDIRARLAKSNSRIRQMGPDYLAYCLMDAVIDNYFLVTETVQDRIESIEKDLLDDPPQSILNEIHTLKSQLLYLRKTVWPLRDMCSLMLKSESPLLTDPIRMFLRDLYDHSYQIVDVLELNRDLVSGMMELYLTIVSNRMNSVMKVLTMIGTLFIPLTFLAGIYGMNFKFMPELNWKYGYPAFWITITLMVVIIFVLFKKKKWL